MPENFNEPPTFHELKSLDDFSAVVCNTFKPKEISCLDQKIKYLYDYLTNKLGATRMLTEEFYFSQSYFDDYKFYHINSYHGFKKTCSRIHFFRKKETKNSPELFDNEQSDEKTIEFWNSYLGYIVVRPLPEGIIGATLLKYPYVEDLHYVPRLTITTEEKINIFGFQINNFKTLIYQEQDRIVGACATTALWSALDKAHDLFDIPHYSPSKLTELAGKSHIGKKPQRKFPNKGGLNLFQISEVLDKIGLDHDTIINEGNNQSENAFKEFICAYLKHGIPALLGVEFKDKDLHALTLAGFKEPKDKILLNKIVNRSMGVKGSPIYKAHQIDTFYAHDDQLGPFSQIEIKNINEVIIGWEKPEEKNVKIYSLMALIHPTWVINVNTIKKQITILNDLLLNEIGYEKKSFFYWDFYIIKSNEWKTNLKKSKVAQNANIIYTSLPQYLWVIELYRIENDSTGHKSTLALSILIDITSLSDSINIIDFVIHDNHFVQFIKENYNKLENVKDSLSDLLKNSSHHEKEGVLKAKSFLYFLEKIFFKIEKGIFNK